jgi:protein-tyrosine phosphatase
MIDIHCHLIPGIDDGAPNPEAALELARALVQDGVTHAVCTPHVYPGRFNNRRSSIKTQFDALRDLLDAAGIELGLGFAGEVRLAVEILQLLDMDEIPFMGTLPNGDRTMLLELPDAQIPVGSDRFVEKLRQLKVVPVIAHPERNKAVMADPGRIAPFVDMGCRLQLTSGSLIGSFGERAKLTSKRLLDAGWVHAVASDAHNLGGRKPCMAKAHAWLTQRYGSTIAQRLTVQGPAELIQVPMVIAPEFQPTLPMMIDAEWAEKDSPAPAHLGAS